MKSFLIPMDFSSKNEEHVQILQQALIALGYATDNLFSSSSFDNVVKGVTQSFKADNALPATNNITAETIKLLNSQLEELYRVCGELKDDYGMPIEGAVIIVSETKYDETTQIIGTGTSLSDGSYRVYLDIPEEALGKNGLLKIKMSIHVDITQNNVLKLGKDNLLIQDKENIFNFSSDNFMYQGKSVFQSLLDKLSYYGLTGIVKDPNTPPSPTLVSKTVENLVNIGAATGIEIETLMKLVFADVLEDKVAKYNDGGNPIPPYPYPELDRATFFAFLYQELPVNTVLFNEEVLQYNENDWGDYQDKITEQVNIGLTLMTEETLHNALLTASKTYIIDTPNNTWIDTNVSLIMSKRENVLMNSPLLEGEVTLSEIIDEADTNLSLNQKREIANLFVANINDFSAFIDLLDKEENRNLYGTTIIDKLIFTFQISQITRNHLPSIGLIKAKYQTIYNMLGIRILATIPKEYWLSHLSMYNTYPSDFKNIEDYVEFIYNNIQKLYPEMATIENIESSANGKFNYITEIKTVLLENKDCDILTNKIEDFTINSNLENNPQFMEEFRTVQRVHRISPSPEVTATLLDNNITNAAQVYFMGKDKLTATFSESLSAAEIDNVYAMATARYANALIAYTNLNNAFNSNNPYALPQYDIQYYIDNLIGDIPNIAQLFGEQDHCECDHDSSVFSPGAYLADLLLFLDEQSAKDNATEEKKSILEFLKDRRADISKIILDKQNTQTMLPYIDLVNEILEEVVIKSADSTFVRDPKTCQSNLSTEELLAAPEHILKSASKGTAYDVLKRSMYPMYAPINLEQMESRAYLSKMGIARHDLMNTFGKEIDNITDANIAAEYFGLTNLDQLVITAASNYTLSERNEAWTKTLGTGNTVIPMGVTEFMQNTALTAHEVLDIIAATWTKLTGQNITEDCSFKDKNITSTPAGFDRAHRFIRLWCKSEWKMWELNLMLFNSTITHYVNENTDNLNNLALRNLYLFSQQQKELGLSCDSLVAFYGKINAFNMYENGKLQPCLYDKLFLNTAVENPVNERLADVKKELSSTANTTNKTITGADDELVAACLSISKKDYDLLKLLYPQAKNIEYLSYLYRHATFAKKLKISIPELLTILKMRGTPITEVYTISEVNEVMATVQLIKESKISIFEYEYLTKYGHGISTISDEAKEYALTNEQLEEYVKTLRDGLSQKETLEEVTSQEENTEEFESNSTIALRNLIAELFNLSSDIVKTYLKYPVNGVETLSDILLNLIESYNDLNSSGGTEETISKKIYKILILLHKASLFIKRNNITPDQFETLLKIQNRLKFNWLAFRTDNTEQPLPISITGNPLLLTLQDFLNLNSIMILHKSYGIIDNGIDNGSQQVRSLFLAKTLLDLLLNCANENEGNPTSSAFISNLCKITGWDTPDCTALIETHGFGFKYKDFYKASSYTKIQRCMEMLNRMNVPTGTIIGISNSMGWKKRNITESEEVAQNTAIKNALKAKYDIKTWLKELATIQKPIREAKTNALSSHLIAVSRRKSANPIQDKIDLYNIYLLDPEMSADMKTSRIVQATCAVQLFMQRIFLNLENLSELSLKEEQWKQWEWMKRYRLWEANFKVFLYPENFIEPELRDDKSPFFKEMEDELNQSDITEEHVETVFVNYLQKLHEVANLTVVGLYNEDIPENQNAILHVVGRSRSTPYQYYYRNFNQSSKAWSHWEKIELDIKGEVVVPVVYKRKLHLFWISTMEKTFNNSISELVRDSINYTEIQLEWSVLKNKKWSPVKVSKKKLVQKNHRPVINYSLVAQCANNEIEFRIYRYGYENRTNPVDYYSNGKFLGAFYFNGNTYGSMSHIDDFGDTETAMLASFDSITNDMSIDTKPEIQVSTPNSVWPRFAHFRASRLYPMKENNANEIYLTTYNNTPPCRRLIGSINQEANIALMVHNATHAYEENRIKASHYEYPFFYQDSKRSFFIKPSVSQPVNGMAGQYTFYPFYHPYTDLLIQELSRCGIAGMLNRDIQLNPHDYFPKNNFKFDVEYSPNTEVVGLETTYNANHDIMDFEPFGAYSPYNWELFFHAPLYIACKLSQNQKHEEAMKWFHYIFNPTDKSTESVPKKFWITKPFYETNNPESWGDRIKNMLTDVKEKASAVQEWINNPFNPHLVARTRPTAFQKTVVMKYIDNLIAWGDQLFRQDTMESNNEATLLYILAYEILGKRPITIPAEGLDATVLKSYEKIAGDGDIYAFLNDFDLYFNYNYTEDKNIVRVASASVFSMQGSSNKGGLSFEQGSSTSGKVENGGSSKVGGAATMIMVQQQVVQAPHITTPMAQLAPRINPKAFCVPFNENLLRYWDTVEDRLFKLRHCMNIDGFVRELPLFAPPIDPAMLVKAAAAGLSIADALNEINAQQPYYRFRIILQKAIEFTGEVKQLGEKLLAALEKKDAEVLNLLRSSQEINMQQAMKQVRKLQIDEAKQNIVALKETIKNTEVRKNYYGSKELMNKLETTAYRLNNTATIMNDIVAAGHVVAAIAHAIPNFTIGVSGVFATPVVTAAYGGENVGNAINAAMTALSQVSQCLDKHASLLLTKSSYQRRKEDWDFQAKTASLEINQLNKQLLATEIRLMIAERELQNMELQIEQSQSVNEYYMDKFTNEQLYNWMITEISKVYLDAYKLAYDMAKKAELCYRKELGICGVDSDPNTPYIQFGHWDSLKKGLLSGDRLMHALHRLDAAYINKNKRTLELTKNISMAEMFPKELLELITKKETTLNLKEFLFDMDYPGNYMRRIKSVAVTIPNVAGPNTTVSFMLKLNNAKVRLNSSCGDPEIPGIGYNEEPLGNDARFNYQTGGDMICTSSAQNDSGLFELNFGDDRYLPFENAGAISEWTLSFPAGCDQFDLSTVSDVILHIKYTAFYEGVLALKAKTALQNILPDKGRIFFSLKHGFSAEWGQLNETNNMMNFELKTEHLPFFLRGKANDLNVSTAALVLSSKNSTLSGKTLNLSKEASALNFNLTLAVDSNNNPIAPCGDIYFYNASASNTPSIPVKGDWKATLGTTQNSIDSNDVEDIIIGFNLEV